MTRTAHVHIWNAIHIVVQLFFCHPPKMAAVTARSPPREPPCAWGQTRARDLAPSHVAPEQHGRRHGRARALRAHTRPRAPPAPPPPMPGPRLGSDVATMIVSPRWGAPGSFTPRTRQVATSGPQRSAGSDVGPASEMMGGPAPRDTPLPGAPRMPATLRGANPPRRVIRSLEGAASSRISENSHAGSHMRRTFRPSSAIRC